MKRTVSRYYLDVCSVGIATPSEAYEACAEYLAARRAQWPPDAFETKLNEDVDRLTGEIEQDLRQRHRGIAVECLEKESLAARVIECMEAARGSAGL